MMLTDLAIDLLIISRRLDAITEADAQTSGDDGFDAAYADFQSRARRDQVRRLPRLTPASLPEARRLTSGGFSFGRSLNVDRRTDCSQSAAAAGAITHPREIATRTGADLCSAPVRTSFRFSPSVTEPRPAPVISPAPVRRGGRFCACAGAHKPSKLSRDADPSDPRC